MRREGIYFWREIIKSIENDIEFFKGEWVEVER